MHYTLNEHLHRIDITAPCGYVVAFIEYRNFGKCYAYFARLLDNELF